MLARNVRIYAEREPILDTLRFTVIAENDKTIQMAEPIVMSPVPDDILYGAQPTSPTFRLDLTGAQFLMDQLWICGLRPSEGTGSAGALAATQDHLRTVQTVMTKLLDKVLTP